MGNYPEMAVKHLFEEFSNRDELKAYFPPKVGKNRSLNKKFFFDVVSTFCHDELKSILEHANAQRNSVEEEDEKKEAIMMSEFMCS